MTGPVVGLMLPTVANTEDGRVDPGRVIEAARRAEAAGFDGVYVGDHLVHPRPLLESVVTLSAIATSTDRVSIGPCVMLISLRQPVVLARQLATLSCFAPGRLRIGVGVGGEYPGEFDAAGVPLAERGRRMESALLELRALLVRSPGAACEVPMLVAGRSNLSLRRAAKYGDGWIGYLLSPDSFARRRSFLMAERVRGGRPELFSTGMVLPVHPDADATGARARAAAGWAKVTANETSFPDRLFVAGPPDHLVDQLRCYWEAGCTEMMLGLVDQGAAYLDQLDMLAAEVLPKLRAFT